LDGTSDQWVDDDAVVVLFDRPVDEPSSEEATKARLPLLLRRPPELLGLRLRLRLICTAVRPEGSDTVVRRTGARGFTASAWVGCPDADAAPG
jgi:hypothetical protein